MMKSSTRRCSFGSIQSSGLKASGALPRGACAAIWQGRSETSKFSTRAAPDSPATSRRHVASTPHASGVTMPRPVTATRLMRSVPSSNDAALALCAPSRVAGRPQRDEGRTGRRPSRARGNLLGRETASPRALSLLIGRGLLQELYRIADGDDRLGLVVGDLDPKLFFEGHHQLNRVERVGAEIVDEVRAVDDFVGFHAEVLDDDLLY